MSESKEFLVAQKSERDQNILRIYAVAEGSGALVIPRCVVDLRGVPSAVSAILSPEWAKRHIRANAVVEEPMPEDIVSTDGDNAVEEVMEFMRGHLPSADPVVSDDFVELFAEKHPELETMIRERFGEEPTLHTGFYL